MLGHPVRNFSGLWASHPFSVVHYSVNCFWHVLVMFR